MKFFIDTANVEDIKKANDMGVICGVTTNPSLIAKEGRDFKKFKRWGNRYFNRKELLQYFFFYTERGGLNLLYELQNTWN